ncbi:MAG: ferrous iron transport protein A [Gammaproteobacteria bacterium]|nr:ferrous iron transport protein A [Gammaproteobacteria bacterium]
MSEMTLSNLKPNLSAEIVKIQGESELKNRLASLGFIRGTKIEVSHSAILGGPRSYLVRGSQISLRKSEADQIIVKVE